MNFLHAPKHPSHDRAPRRPGLRPAFLLACLALALGGAPLARAATFTVDAALGAEMGETISQGDVQTFRLALTAGTIVEVEARGDASKDVGPDLTLTLLDPDGTPAATATGPRAKVSLAVPTTGVWRAEVRAAGSTSYVFRTEVTAGTGDGGGTGTAGPGETTTIHADVPRGAEVRIDVIRVSGATPEVVAVRDGQGRDLGVYVKRGDARRIRLHEIHVPAPGGLDIEVRGAGGGAGTYRVRAEVEEIDDDHGGEAEREDREIIVQLAPGADAAAIAASLGYELISIGDGFAVLRTPEGREGFEDEDAADADDREADVIAAEPTAVVVSPEGDPNPAGTGTLGLILGSDLGKVLFETQPALTFIRASAARQLATGAGVTVAVLDTGIAADFATHPAFAGRTVLAGRDFVDGDDEPFETTDGVDNDLDGLTDEGFGHGTFIAGLVTVAAPGAAILPVRVLDTDGRGTVARTVSGIRYAMDSGANVINLSFGSDAGSPLIADAVRLALARGIVVVAAAGNGGARAGLDFPASINGVIAVGGLTATGTAPAAFTDGTTGVTIAGPATQLTGPVPGGTFVHGTGTSFAAALASAGAAMLLERRPTLLPAQVHAKFVATARIGGAGLPASQRRRLGAGRLDLQRLVR